MSLNKSIFTLLTLSLLPYSSQRGENQEPSTTEKLQAQQVDSLNFPPETVTQEQDPFSQAASTGPEEETKVVVELEPVKEALYLFLDQKNRQCWDYLIKKKVNVFTASPKNFSKLTVESSFFRIVANPTKFNDTFAVATEIPCFEQKTKLIKGKTLAEAICEFIEELERTNLIKPQSVLPVQAAENTTAQESPQESSAIETAPQNTTALEKVDINQKQEKKFDNKKQGSIKGVKAILLKNINLAKLWIFGKENVWPAEITQFSIIFPVLYIAYRVGRK